MQPVLSSYSVCSFKKMLETHYSYVALWDLDCFFIKHVDECLWGFRKYLQNVGGLNEKRSPGLLLHRVSTVTRVYNTWKANNTQVHLLKSKFESTTVFLQCGIAAFTSLKEGGTSSTPGDHTGEPVMWLIAAQSRSDTCSSRQHSFTLHCTLLLSCLFYQKWSAINRKEF